jgi:hypothetical protein
MNEANDSVREFSDIKIHVKLKLSALWSAVMFCYVYGDLFGFFKQSTLSQIVSGKAGFIGTKTGLLAAAVSMAVPSLMVILSLVFKPVVCRWSNIVLGVLYTIIIIGTMPGAWVFRTLPVESCVTAEVKCGGGELTARSRKWAIWNWRSGKPNE